MVSSFTPNKGFDKPANGDYVDTWNIPVNADWDIADKAFGGTYSVSLTNVNVTLTQANCQNVRILLTGNLSGNVDIRFPSGVSGFFVVTNATTGAFTVTLKSLGGGSSVITTQGLTCFVFTDGTNVFFADDTRGSVVAGTGISVTGIGTQTISLQTPVSIANGGTGVTSFPSGNVVIGNGSSPLQVVAPGVVGNVLTSTGTSWVSAAPSGGGGGSGILSIGFQGALGSGLTFTPSSVTTSGQTVVLSGTLAMGFGGTGTTSISSGFVTSNGSSLTSQSKIALASDVSGILPLGNGGTGQISFATGFITSNGVALSSQSKVSLTADVSGTLPWGNGGTGQTSFTSGFVKSNGTALSGGNNVNLASASDVTGTLPFGNGGTNSTTIAAGLVRSTGSALNGAATVALGSEVSGQLPLANGGTGTTLVNVSGFLKGPGVGGTAVGASATVNLSSEVSSFLSVANGGTGATTFSAGYLKANGTAAFTTVSGISATDITSGTLSTTNGGTGANLSAASGLIRASGGVFSASAVNLASAGDVGSSILQPANGGTGINALGTGVATALGQAVSGTTGGLIRANGTFSGTHDGGSFSGTISGSATFSGALTFSNTGVAINSSGDISVPNNKSIKFGNGSLNSTGTAGSIYLNSTTTSIYGDSAQMNFYINSVLNSVLSPTTFTIQAAITPYTTNAWVVTSDARIKKDVADYNVGLSAIDPLRVVTFKYNGEYGSSDNGQTQVGLIAQEVQGTPMASMVKPFNYTDPKTGEVTELFGLQTDQLIFTLINAVKELDARVKALEAKASAG